MRCLECGAESAEPVQVCTRCGAPIARQVSVSADRAEDGSGSPGAVTIARGRRKWLRLDDDGIMIRNGDRTRRIGWDEVRWFRDSGPAGYWDLAIVLHDGRTIGVGGNSTWRAAPPETLAAIRQAAERHAVPAVLSGGPVREGKPDDAGLYPDPGGKPGLRQWTGTGWSPFLEVDPARSGPEGGKGPARVWSPLPEPEQQRQWDAAASRATQARVWFRALLGATAVAGAVILAVFLYDLGQPQASVRWAGGALFWLSMPAAATFGVWADLRKCRKVDRAGKAAAELASTTDSTASALDDQGEDTLAD